MTEDKTQLTAREKIACYTMNRLHGVDQHVIAASFGINSARVAEAILAIEYAVENTMAVYKTASTRRKIK